MYFTAHKYCTRPLPVFHILLGVLALAIGARAAGPEAWVAFNDHFQGPNTHSNATVYAPPAFGINSGPLRDIVTGAALPVALTITNNPGIQSSWAMTGPAPGTPAYQIFNGYIDWNFNIDGLATNGILINTSNTVGYVFTGLDTTRMYRFAGTAIRGDAGVGNRWTRVELLGAASATPGHSSNVITADQFPANLSDNQAAFNSGRNDTPATGDVVDWENIIPGPEGQITVLCTRYSGLIPGGTNASGRAAYAFSALRLEQMAGHGRVMITDPPDNSFFSEPEMLAITAEAFGVDVPTNVQFYADGVLLGSSEAAPFSVVWSNPPLGSHQLTAVGWSSDSSMTSPVVNVTLISNVPPQVGLTSPLPGSTYSVGDTIPMVAAVSDLGGAVARVDFYAETLLVGSAGSSPFAYNWSGTSEGTFTLRAVARDSAGLSATSAPVNITIITGPVATLVNGPYLQISSPTGMVVRWRTDPAVSSRVRYGTDAADLSLVAGNDAATIEHEILLGQLLPDTKYYYQIGSTNQVLAQGADLFFHSAPVSAKPTRIWVTGDTRTGDANQRRVYDAYRQFTGSNYTHVWLLMGDNGGESGTDLQFQVNFFDMFTNILQQTVAYPCIGNHDSYSLHTYLNLFCLPTAGEAGGVPSGSERYYSFNYGKIHFVVLDSVTSDISTNGPMYAWLARDLAANTNDWLIAYWHYTPYSKGSHDSDTESGMVYMRERFVPLLEANGADLLLFGHSHGYERSYLLDGHYDVSSTLTSAMLKDDGDGRPDGDGAYRKPDLGPHPHQGAVYAVVGSSGLVSCGPMNHPAMYLSECNFGSMVIDIDGNRLDAKFLRDTGAIDDHFTIIKGGGVRITSVHVEDGAVVLTWNTTPGQRYVVQRKADLNGTWEAASAILDATANSLTWSDTAIGAASAFYRIEQVPFP